MDNGFEDSEEMDKDKVKLNRVTNGDIGTLNLVVTSMREIESALELKKNEIENKKKYTRQDLTTMDLVLVSRRWLSC